jgi:hypothetical protein
MSIFFN